MDYEIDNIKYRVNIIRKKNRNTYLRVKNGEIIVTTNYLMPNYKIEALISDNIKQIKKMISTDKVKSDKDKSFYYLGNKYDIMILSSVEDTYIDGSTIYTSSEKELNKWLKQEIKVLFNARYRYLMSEFEESNLKYDLVIRKMTSRWGVNNRRSKKITLNTNLIKYDIKCLDYVIIHELCHHVHFDHSKEFWKLVEKYVPNYKEIKKELKE